MSTPAAAARRSPRRAPFALLACEPRQYLTISLLADLNSAPAGAADYGIGGAVTMGGYAYYVLNDGTRGYELWKTDGTAAGTSLVKDIAPGPSSAFPGTYTKTQGSTTTVSGAFQYAVTAAGNRMYFTANDVGGGAELWATDGTTAGTYRVKDIRPGIAGSFPTALVAGAGNNVFFLADDGVHGRELWFSDGTDAGTHLVYDLNPGAAGQPTTNLAYANGKVFLDAYDGNNRGEPYDFATLYTSTGAAGNVTFVKTFVSSGLNVRNLTAFGNRVFFRDENADVWSSDGTAAGTFLVARTNAYANLTNPFYPTTNALYFTEGQALYRIPSGSTSPSIVTTAAGNLASLTPAGGDLYFTANASSTSATPALFRVPLNTTSASLVKDLGSAAANASPTNLTPVGAALYFSTGSAASGFTLWKSTGGAAATTNPVATVAPAATSQPSPTLFAPAGNRLLFVNEDSTAGRELWTSDGTAPGTALLRGDAYPGTASSGPLVQGFLGDTLLLFAKDATHGQEPWAINVTTGAATLLADINPGLADGVRLGESLIVGGKAYFAGTTPAAGEELWVTDGTPAGTHLVKDVRPGTASGSPFAELAGLNGKAYFGGYDGGAGGPGLYVSDGTAAGTTLVKAVSIGKYLLAGTSRLYFTAGGAKGGTELWVSDGTAVGTHVITGAIPEGGDNSMTVVGDTLYYVSTTAAYGTEIWRSDGTPAGTQLLRDITPGTGYASLRDLSSVGGVLSFTLGGDLWTSDGTAAGTTVAAHAFDDPLAAGFGVRAALDGQLVFTTVASPGSVATLWRTAPGTTTPVLLSNSILAATSPLVADGRVFFVGTDEQRGAELWVTDGTPAGTYAMASINPGTGSGVRGPIVTHDHRLYFAGNNGLTGYEPYTVNDIAPPRVSATSFDASTGRGVRVTFSEELAQPIGSVARVTNTDTGQDLPAGAFTVGYDPATSTLNVTLTGAPADANYRLTIGAYALKDVAGNALSSNTRVDFFTLAADANHDRVVNFDDLLLLAKNYNKTATTFAQGDFTGDGLVNFDDLLILAKAYNKTLPQPAAPAPLATAAPISPAAITPTPPPPPPTPTKKPTTPIFSTQKVLPPTPPKKTTPPRKPPSHH